MKIGIVGAGRAGTAVAVLLQRAGHEITGVSGRGPTRDRASRFLPGIAVMEPVEVVRASELAIVAVPDDLIETVVGSIADAEGFRPGRWVAHLSGATPLAALDRAREAGAGRLGLHPLQTFPDPAAGIARIPGSLIALEADDDAGSFIAERTRRRPHGRAVPARGRTPRALPCRRRVRVELRGRGDGRRRATPRGGRCARSRGSDASRSRRPRSRTSPRWVLRPLSPDPRHEVTPARSSGTSRRSPGISRGPLPRTSRWPASRSTSRNAVAGWIRVAAPRWRRC